MRPADAAILSVLHRPCTINLQWQASATITAANDARSQFVLNDGGADSVKPVGDLVVDVFGYFT